MECLVEENLANWQGACLMMEVEETTFAMRAAAAPTTHHFEPCAFSVFSVWPGVLCSCFFSCRCDERRVRESCLRRLAAAAFFFALFFRGVLPGLWLTVAWTGRASGWRGRTLP